MTGHASNQRGGGRPSFSPLGNHVLSPTGLWLELGTPIFQARFPSPLRADLRSRRSADAEPSMRSLGDLLKHPWTGACLRPHFRMRVPRAPLSLLAAAMQFFRGVMTFGVAERLNENEVFVMRAGCERNPGEKGGLAQLEALVWLTYAPERGWRLAIPPQVVAPGAVETGPIAARDRVGMVIHSHGRLEAYFSGVDDADETDGLIYGVAGRLHQAAPSVRFRVGYAGHFLDVEVADVFDIG
jgi:hypothetical protein